MLRLGCEFSNLSATRLAETGACMGIRGAAPIIDGDLGCGSSSPWVIATGCSCATIQSAICRSASAGRSLKQIPASLCVGPNHTTRPAASIGSSLGSSRKRSASSASAFSLVAAWRDSPPVPRLTMMPPFPGPSSTYMIEVSLCRASCRRSSGTLLFRRGATICTLAGISRNDKLQTLNSLAGVASQRDRSSSS
jgi:hypothetical protein